MRKSFHDPDFPLPSSPEEFLGGVPGTRRYITGYIDLTVSATA